MKREPRSSDFQTVLKVMQRIDKQFEADNAALRFTVIPHLGKGKNKEKFSRFLQTIDWTKYRRKNKYSSNAKNRSRLNEYVEYLRVWDFRQHNQALTWTEIASQLYPEDFRKYDKHKDRGIRNAVVQRAVDRNKRAEQLINGGFQEIT